MTHPPDRYLAVDVVSHIVQPVPHPLAVSTLHQLLLGYVNLRPSIQICQRPNFAPR